MLQNLGDERKDNDRMHDQTSNDLVLRLQSVTSPDDILPNYRDTPIGAFLAAHCLGHQITPGPNPELVIMTCMDSRVLINLPSGFSFQVRTAGAAPAPVMANIAFAVAVAGVRHIAMIAHTDCAMCQLDHHQPTFHDTLLTSESWTEDLVEMMSESLHSTHKVHNPIESAWEHTEELDELFPSCTIAPLLYKVEDHTIHQVVRD